MVVSESNFGADVCQRGLRAPPPPAVLVFVRTRINEEGVHKKTGCQTQVVFFFNVPLCSPAFSLSLLFEMTDNVVNSLLFLLL